MSVSTRVRSLFFAAALAAGALAASTALAQGQGDPPTSRNSCIKVAPGKGAEFREFLRDVVVPMAQVRADAGEFDWFMAARGIVPAGSSATCDYRLVYLYKGLPPEPPSRESLEPSLKAAKLNMTWEQFVAKRGALTSLVATEIWTRVDSVGPRPEKGSYLRVNHYKVNSGEWSEWVRMERTYWKPLVEAWLKDGGKGSWVVNRLWMPAGDALPYDAVTVDAFPDWNGLVRAVPVGQLWPKVHPDTTSTEVFNRMGRLRSVHDREVYRVEEVVRAK